MLFFSRTHYLLAALSGALFVLSMPPWDLGFLRWVALVPLLVALTQTSGWRRYLVAYLFGLVALLGHYQMILESAPLEWLGITSAALGFSIGVVAWIIICAVLALSTCILAPSGRWPILFPVLWVGYELLRAHLTYVVFYGAGAVFGDHFSLGNFAYSLHDSPLLPYLAPLGIYVVVLLIGAVNLGLYYLYARKGLAYVLVLAVILVASEFVPMPPVDTTKIRSLEVLVLQADHAPALHYDNAYYESVAAEYESALLKGLEEFPNTAIVLLPENSALFGTLATRDGVSEQMVYNRLTAGAGTLLGVVYGTHLRAYDTPGTVVATYSTSSRWQLIPKSYLMPFGEYQPTIISIIARLIGKGEWGSSVLSARENMPITDAEKTTRLGDLTIGILSCSESLSPTIARKAAKGSDILLEEKRLAVFYRSQSMYAQARAMSQFLAAQYSIPVATSLDGGGVSYVVDRNGVVVAEGVKGDAYLHAILSL